MFFLYTEALVSEKNTCLLKDDDSHQSSYMLCGTQMTLLLVGKGSGFEGLTMSFWVLGI